MTKKNHNDKIHKPSLCCFQNQLDTATQNSGHFKTLQKSKIEVELENDWLQISFGWQQILVNLQKSSALASTWIPGFVKFESQTKPNIVSLFFCGILARKALNNQNNARIRLSCPDMKPETKLNQFH